MLVAEKSVGGGAGDSDAKMPSDPGSLTVGCWPVGMRPEKNGCAFCSVLRCLHCRRDAAKVSEAAQSICCWKVEGLSFNEP